MVTCAMHRNQTSLLHTDNKLGSRSLSKDILQKRRDQLFSSRVVYCQAKQNCIILHDFNEQPWTNPSLTSHRATDHSQHVH